MLTHEDFEGIGRVVEKKIQELVPPMIKAGINELVPPMIRAGVKEGIDELETRMDTKFDAVQEQLDDIRQQMVTKDYLDARLEHYVRKPNPA